jgi:hypothetical protein
MKRLVKEGVAFWVCALCQGGYRDDEPCFQVKAGDVVDDGDVKYNRGVAGICGDCAIDLIRNRT